MDEDNLTIPHPSFAARDFVLRPLCDLDPNFIDPLSGMSVSSLLERIPAIQSSIKHRSFDRTL